jgi:F-type H+-transporting ATPase subunit b
MRLNKRLVLVTLVMMAVLMVNPAFAAEESGDPLGTLGINMGLMISQWINFVTVFLLLTVLLWRPMLNAMDARAAKIKKGIEDAAAAANARRNAEAEAEKILAQAQREAQQIVAGAQGKGEEVAKQIEAEARKKADQTLADAKVAATTARDAELAGMRGDVTRIAVAIAQRLIGEALDEKRQKALVSDFLTSVPAGAKNLSGAVEVTSAMPLEAAEQDKVKKALGASDVAFKVDPAILGGLVVSAGGRVIDGSVRNNLNNLSGRLN